MNDPAPVGPNTLLSWSLPRSGAVARALREWLPRVVQACDPWMSAEDIYAGKRWRREVAQQLAGVKVGIVCATPENLDRRWLNYEAGALSVRVPEQERVIAYCLGMAPDDCGDPLNDFFGVRADKPGTLKMVESINASMVRPIKGTDLEAIFERLWPDLDKALTNIPADPTVTKVPKRSDSEVLAEILARVKGLEDAAPRTAGGPLERMFRSPDPALFAAAMRAKIIRDRFIQEAIEMVAETPRSGAPLSPEAFDLEGATDTVPPGTTVAAAGSAAKRVSAVTTDGAQTAKPPRGAMEQEE